MRYPNQGCLPHPGFVALAVCAPRADTHPHAVGAVIWHAATPRQPSTWLRRCPADSPAPPALAGVPVTTSDYLGLVGGWHNLTAGLFASGYSLIVDRILLDTSAFLVDAYSTMGDPADLPPLVIDVATSLVDAGHPPDVHRYLDVRHIADRVDLGGVGHPLRNAHATMLAYLDLRGRCEALWRKTPWYTRAWGLRRAYRCPHHDPGAGRSWISHDPRGLTHRCAVCGRHLTVDAEVKK